MKSFIGMVVAGVILLTIPSVHIDAASRGGGGSHGGGRGGYHSAGSYHGGGYHGSGGSYHGGSHGSWGHYHGGYHGWGGWGARIYVGGGWWGWPWWGPGWWGSAYAPYPYYSYYGYYNGPSGYVPGGATEYIQPSNPPSTPTPQYWYYCPNSQAYYPYVKECSVGWMKVLPQPSPPADIAP